MKDLKYLIAYIVPLSVVLGLYMGGIFSFLGFIVAFVMIPLFELFWKGTTANHMEAEEDSRAKQIFFDLVLYMNVPLIYFILCLFLYRLVGGGLEIYEMIGMTISTGIILGGNGINIAHELGHRNTWYERTMAKMLLLPSFYMHFIIEHNHGHHKWVSTDKDPASSRFNENVYFFFVRSTVMSYVSAWQIAAEQTSRAGHAAYGLRNPMYPFVIIQTLYLLAVGFICGWIIVPFAIVAGILGFLLLELVNYIEHYGLRRSKTASGRYEPVKPHHSWNSNHEIGRIVLYELTRHSDHHFKANRKYQILRHFDDSPQMPLGYPGSMLLALVPPLWFAYMNPKVEEARKKFNMPVAA